MAKLRKAIVKFDKNKKSGKVRIEFLHELSEPQDRLAITKKFKREVESVLVKDDFSWSYLFEFYKLSFYDSGHNWYTFEFDLLRVNKPPEWSDEFYEDCIAYQVRQLCHFVMDHVNFIEEDLLQEKFPEVSRTLQFDEG